MDILPYLLLVLFAVFLIGIVVVFLWLRSKEPPSGLPDGESRTDSRPGTTTSPIASTKGTADLETMRLAVEQMETDHIANLLEMGATLKPGAEEIFRQELEKRRQAEAD